MPWRLAVELGEHAKLVSVLVDPAGGEQRLAEHQAPPRSGDQTSVDVAGRGPAPPVQQRRHGLHGHQHRLGLGVGAEVDDVGEDLQEAADGDDPPGQLRPPLHGVVGPERRRQLGDDAHRSPKLVPGHHGLDRRPRLGQAHRLGAADRVQDCHCGSELGRGRGEAEIAAQLLLVGLPLGPADQFGGHQHVQQLQGVVGRSGFQVGHRRHQRGQAAGRAVAVQQGRLGAYPVAGQLHQAPLRYLLQVQRADAHGPDLRDPFQRLHHGRSRNPGRPLPPALQVTHPGALGDHQHPVQPLPLLGRRQSGQCVPQPLRGLVPDPGHQARQRRHPRQEHIALSEPHDRVGEDRHGAIPSRPAPGVDPRHQSRLGIGELAQVVPVPDLPRVLEACLSPLGVALHARRVRHLQLAGQVVDHCPWHVQRIGQERAQVAGRGQLESEAEAVVVAPSSRHQRPVGVIEEEGSLQLGARRRAVVATETGRLLIRQEFDRHDSHGRDPVPSHAFAGTATDPRPTTTRHQAREGLAPVFVPMFRQGVLLRGAPTSLPARVRRN